MSLTVAGIAEARRKDLALADDRVRYSWAQLDPILNRATNAMLGLPLEPERRVAVFAPNSAETVLAYVAALQAGVSSVPVSYHLTVDELTYILTSSGATTLFVGPETAEAGLAAAATAGVATVIGWRCGSQPGLTAWEDWLADASAGEPPTDMLPRPHLHYTSGTTGRPKAAETPPGYFPPAPDMAAFVAILRQRATPSPGLVVGPLYHTGPLTMVRSLAGGSALVVMPSFDPERALALIEAERIAGSVMVPTHFQRLLALPAEVRARYDVSSMKRLAHTGAACPRDVKQAMIAWFGPVLVEAYGGTEAGTTHAITSEEWLRKPGSVGRAAAPLETVVIGPDGTTLGANEIGQLYVRDPSGRGIVYHGDPEKTAAAHIAPGVFTLGEMGYVDDEGYVFITDRMSDMIVSGGREHLSRGVRTGAADASASGRRGGDRRAACGDGGGGEGARHPDGRGEPARGGGARSLLPRCDRQLQMPALVRFRGRSRAQRDGQGKQARAAPPVLAKRPHHRRLIQAEADPGLSPPRSGLRLDAAAGGTDSAAVRKIEPVEPVEKPISYSSPAIRERRRRILDETRKLIAEQGIGNFSMNELCTRAGVAKRTLYNAFQTRERLVAVAIQEYFEDYLSRIPYTSEVGTLARNIERIVAVNRRNRKIRNYIRAIMAIYFSPDVNPDIWQAMHSVAAQSNLEWIRNLQRRRQLQPWVDAEQLADDIVRYEYATINDWARGMIAEDALIPRLITSYLIFMAGATRGAARAEIEELIRKREDEAAAA